MPEHEPPEPVHLVGDGGRDETRAEGVGRHAGTHDPPVQFVGEPAVGELAILQDDWTLAQHAAALLAATGIPLKKSSVGNYLKRLEITYKKRVLSPPNETKRRE